MEGNHGAFANPGSRASHGHVPPTSANGADINALGASFGGMSLTGVGSSSNHPGVSVGPTYQWMNSFVDNMHPGGFGPIHPNLGMVHNENPYAQVQAPGYSGGYFGLQGLQGLQMPVANMGPFTPARASISQARPDRGQSDVPSLDNRRGSYSTNESTPATPFWTGLHRENGPRVASLDRSAYTTPSPQNLGMSSINTEVQKPVTSTVSEIALEELLQRSPAVPKAVPAVFTPPGQMKTVDQSLENRIPGNRNVYIRGLHPTTDDDLLYQFAARFGAVETSKAIIDTGTGACKGFGFAKFYSVRDSEMCIRGFHRLGYEVGFARESFNSRLKSQGDVASTNLYISNLPKTLNEVELGTIFLGYNILSSKILRDSMGNSRGVGFARFESRDVCDEIIQKFNGIGVGEEGLLMNIRYADTPAQKELKRVTAERRQFRTNEYNIGAYGTPLVGMSPSIFPQHGQWQRNGRPVRSDDTETARKNGASGSQPGDSQTATSASTDRARSVSTPTSSECDDEGVTIHADPTSGLVASESVQSSPSGKKTTAKKDTK